MFEISFAELLMIAIVGLLVIGPERLPKVARTLGAYTGRLQRYVTEVKEEVNREVRFEELQALQQEIKEGASQAESNVKASLMSGERDIDQALYELGEEVDAKTTPVKTTKAKPVAKKQAPKKVPAKKAATRKPAAKKTAAKKPAVKKLAARKSPARKSSVKPADKKVD